jgi:hypothetical protein
MFMGWVMLLNQYMNIWAIEHDMTMDGADVSGMVANAFLRYEKS